MGLGVGMVMAASSEAMALQIGGVLGTSVQVSVISSRVGSALTGELTDAGVSAQAAHGLSEARDAVAMGVAPVSDAAGALLGVPRGAGRTMIEVSNM